jgi:hypothetical protein
MKVIIFAFSGLLCCLPNLRGQDIESIIDNVSNLKDQPLTITGGIRLGANFYDASGIDPRRDAFQWNARANLTLGFLGISAPFSFAFSDANENFRLPAYTFAGISPTYKWITAHAGDRSLSLSRYTMDGVSFRGGGLELKPGKLRFAAFYGALNRALVNDLNAVGNLNGFYERTGWGGKIGYETKKGSVNLVLFSATDDEQNNPFTGENRLVTPLDNKVISLNGRKIISKRLTLSAEAAHSITNQDKTAPELTDGEKDVGNQLLGLFNPNQSFVTGQAYRIDGYYNLDKMGLRAGYERVTRGFRTLGALFFNNDTERVTAGANRSFMEGKLSLAANGGLERTNLDAEEGETTSRVIASISANYRPTDTWLFNTAYSNFRNDTKLRGRADIANPVDSIFLAQVTQSINGMILRQVGSKERPASVSLVANHQRANNVINDEVSADSQTRFTNLALNYSAGNPADGFQYNAGISTNFTMLGDFTTRALSPALSLAKSFANNALTTQLRTALSFVTSPDAPERDNNILNLSLGANYKLKNGHSLNLSAVHLNRFGAEEARRNFSELYGTLGYGYRFGGRLGGRRSTPNAASVN